MARLTLERGKFSVREAFFPKFNENPKRQKNWAPFDFKGQVMLNYAVTPHSVIHPQLRGIYHTKAFNWAMGTPHGGTPPIKVGEEYFSFFHSRFKHPKIKAIERNYNGVSYCMGAYAFDCEPPFNVTRHTRYPILWADLNLPLFVVSCVFPAGAMYNEQANTWTVSYGNNDVCCRLLTISHDKLIESMKV